MSQLKPQNHAGKRFRLFVFWVLCKLRNAPQKDRKKVPIICVGRRSGRSVRGWLCGKWAGGSSVRFCSCLRSLPSPGGSRPRSCRLWARGARGVVTLSGVGFLSPRAVCGGLLRCCGGALVAPVGRRRRPGAGWGSAAPGAWALPLWVLACCGFGVGAGRGHVFRGWGGSCSAVTNHIGTSMGTPRAWIPYLFPRR